MFPKPTPNQIVKPRLRYYTEERLATLDMTHRELADKMGITTTKLTQRLKSPERFTTEEFTLFFKHLQVEDFWTLVKEFGMGSEVIPYGHIDKMLHPHGQQLGRINVAA